ncbi:peroxisomal succinyl-coenzyme A thioesterase-like [Dunckerocampus dactyliophorus]|uniref:peroxisomal succinyl-coenzyme A thioesterase-like n=1 Tax=Dunckerocampus dactyliophorus TaxID=161453 RepID=UPI00240553F2|nr:peroxisomal succinyl-coenzyme A thioesterase-like [Dunckerocampus dactyliophorus]
MHHVAVVTFKAGDKGGADPRLMTAQGSRGMLEPIPTDFGRQAGYTLNCTPLCRRASAMSQGAWPLLSVKPTRALVDEAFKVLVENLPPGAPVTLRSLHQSEDRDYWEAYGHYISTSTGVVSVTDDLSLGGTYQGREAMGLLWSMQPVPGSRTGLRLRKMNVRSPMLVSISVYGGHVSEDFSQRPPLATVLTERWYMAPGVRRLDIKDRGVRGTLFIPSGPGPFPGMLDMWGGGGGLLEYRSALLASHGYASLALEYFLPGELASADLELAYFEKAFEIVTHHPAIIPSRVGILGLSLGTIVAMYLASESTVKPTCCVCISGGHFFPRGKTLSAVHQMVYGDIEKLHMDDKHNLIWRDIMTISSDLSWKLDVRRINCPVMLVNGLDDQNTPTVEFAEDIFQMMRSVGKDHLLTRLEYPDTGHLIEPPYSPHFRATNFIWDSKKGKVSILWGGQTKPHSDAQEDSWKKILAFLQYHLYSRQSPRARM